MVKDAVACAIGRNPNSSGSCPICVNLTKVDAPRLRPATSRPNRTAWPNADRARHLSSIALAKEEACEGARSTESKICEPND
jgi:hypothetical protein